MVDSLDDAGAKSEVHALVRYAIEDFGFLVSMVVWHTILFAVNVVSKTLQKEDMHIDVAIDQLNGLVSFLEKYRESGLAEAIDEAKAIASKMEVEPVFHEKRVIHRKKHFDENGSKMTLSAEDSFRVNYLSIVDQALSSLKSQLEQFEKYEEIWGFLFDVNKLKSTTNERLKMYCSKLEDALKHEGTSDINGDELFLELNVFREVYQKR